MAPPATEAASWFCRRKVDIRLHGKENSNSHGARPVYYNIYSMWWIRTSRLSIKNSLSLQMAPPATEAASWLCRRREGLQGYLAHKKQASP